jgi:hypothetical protein
LTPEGCPDCQNGQVDDPYVRRQRYYYSDYEYYDDSLTGFALAEIGEHLDPRFTEADGESLVVPDDEAYESDMSAS